MPVKDTRGIIELKFGGEGLGVSPNVSAQRCINWFPEVYREEDKSKIILRNRLGAEYLLTSGIGPIRGMIVHKEYLYVVSSNTLYKIDSNYSSSSIGTLNTSTGLVSMASNGVFGEQLIIVDGTDGYIYNSGTLAFAIISDAQFPASPTKVTYMDSFFIVLNDGSGQFNISLSNDGTSWDALDFANAERKPDDILSIETLGRDIYFIGENTTEVWTNTGGRFPFEPYTNGVLEIGCVSGDTTAKTASGIVFIAQTERGGLQVVGLSGTNYKKLSSSAVDYVLTGALFNNASAFIFEQDSHIFYQLNLPSSNLSYICNLTLAVESPDIAWHITTTGNHEHLAYVHSYYNRTHIVGDRSLGNLYRLEREVYTDVGEEIIREAVARHMHVQRKRVRYDRFELEFEAGVGLLEGQGSNPIVMLDWSDDGGHTWSNIRYLEFGKVGEYSWRCYTTQLGSSRDRVFRIRISDPVKSVLLGAWAYVEELAH